MTVLFVCMMLTAWLMFLSAGTREDAELYVCLTAVAMCFAFVWRHGGGFVQYADD